MSDLLGSESSRLMEALALEPSVGLRLNGLRLPSQEAQRDAVTALPWRLESVPWCPTGFFVSAGEGAQRPGTHPWHHAGVYYLQDPAAMAVAEALAPRPGERVLDLAAAPGGKTTQLAALLAGTGIVVCNDTHPARARTLLGNVERCGIENAVVCHGEIERLARALPAWFDRVLLDAPCSGEGMFRKSEAARAAWSPRTVAACAARQTSLIAVAAACVRPGGTLAYSTCTFSREENEDVIGSFLERHPSFSLQEVRLPGVSPGLAGARGAARIWPHLAPGEGHFVAVLRRDESDESAPSAAASPGRLGPSSRRSERERGRHTARAAPRGKERAPLARPSSELLRAWREHLAASASGAAAVDEDDLVAHGDRLMLAPRGAPQLPGVHVLRLGLALGELRRDGRTAGFVPAHAAAMAARATWPGEDLELGDPRIERYLAGEEFDAGGDDGWIVVRAGGFPLGWGRRRGGSVRSMLPTGLRRSAS